MHHHMLWAAEFHRGRISLEDAVDGTSIWSCLWRKLSSCVENFVLQNCRNNVQQIADTIGISNGSVKTSVDDNSLCMMGPAMFGQKMKGCWCKVLTENLKYMQLKWNLFMQSRVTGDETWIHHYYPQDQATNHAEEICQFSKSHKFRVQMHQLAR